MTPSYFFLAFLLFLFILSSASSSSSSPTYTPKCSAQQTLALLSFKQNHFSTNHSFGQLDSYVDWNCHVWLGSGYSPVMTNWNTSVDCCNWDGITCDHITGDVIGIDLSCGMLKGTIHPNSTLFHLPRLHRLNLAYNNFTASKIPREIGKLSDSLTHLNISGCFFGGQIPSEITLLSNLVSLDLSWNWYLQFQPYVLNNFLQNSTHLRELLVADINISSVVPTYFNFSSSLNSIDLSWTGLQGNLPDNIFNLPYLEKLELAHNSRLTGPFPEVNTSTDSPLKWLDLSFTSLSGEIPNSIGSLSSLNYLDLSLTSLSGEIPNSIGNLSSLNHLDLSSTSLSGGIPNSIGNLGPLNYLDLRYTNLSGEIPNSIGNLSSLNYLNLHGCSLVGSLPKSLVNLTHLTTLDLSGNMLNGTLPSRLFTLPSLETLDLSYNMFSGSLPSELSNNSSLKEIFLHHNQFDGEANQLSVQLINLTSLDLSYNNFTGLWELDTLFSTLPNLEDLHLSYSGLSVVTNNATGYVKPNFYWLKLASCKLTVFPESLRAMKNLTSLDLSNNDIQGRIPDWAGEIGGNRLRILDLSQNSITGLPQFQWDGLEYLSLQSNQIQEHFPLSICNMSSLSYLDMSNNSFSGVIPNCFGNIISSLWVADLGNNHFHGTIPNVNVDCEQLNGLVLNGNQLEGDVPSFLSKCQNLQVLDIGNNYLNGTFPSWLGDLQWLQILILKSNNLHGSIETSSTAGLFFRSLQVLDLSHNELVGHLPQNYFQKFISMKDLVMDPKPEYISYSDGSYYSIIVVVKGQELLFTKFLVGYTIVDLSDNKFEGEIPNVIGNLNSLKVLNLSHNNLNGRIPHSLGNLSEIESLDLSWNRLTGEIPQSLADITSLEVLNLSNNHLVGRIPEGKQFNTFQGNSFGGNWRLCGFQLPQHCEHLSSPQLEGDGDGDEDEEEDGFTWKVVMLGYGCGIVVGLVMGYVMLSIGKSKWFNAIADALEHMIQPKKKIHIYIRNEIN